MKKQATRLFAILLSMLTVFSFLIPSGSCDTLDHREDPGNSSFIVIGLPSPEDFQNWDIEVIDAYENEFGYVIVEAGDKKGKDTGSQGEIKPVAQHKKSSTQYTNNRQKVYAVTLYANFDYDHKSATCISAYTSIDLSSSNWKVVSSKTTYSGDTARSDVWLATNVTGVWITCTHVQLKIVCDKDGKMK